MDKKRTEAVFTTEGRSEDVTQDIYYYLEKLIDRNFEIVSNTVVKGEGTRVIQSIVVKIDALE